MGLSFASAITNIFGITWRLALTYPFFRFAFDYSTDFVSHISGFIPSPIIFGVVIDTACSAWHKVCPDSGNCLLYDNTAFRHRFHAGNAAFQLIAILAVSFTYWKSKTFQFPDESEEEEMEVEDQNGDPMEQMELRSS